MDLTKRVSYTRGKCSSHLQQRHLHCHRHPAKQKASVHWETIKEKFRYSPVQNNENPPRNFTDLCYKHQNKTRLVVRIYLWLGMSSRLGRVDDEVTQRETEAVVGTRHVHRAGSAPASPTRVEVLLIRL